MEQATQENEKRIKLLCYFANASLNTVQNFEVNKLSEIANLKREIAELTEKLAESEADVRIALLVGNYLRSEV